MTTKISVIRAYAEQLPSIQAQEALQRVSEIAIGNGVMKKERQLSTLREWRKAAGMRPNRVKATTANKEALAQMGLGIKVVHGEAKSRESST